MWIKSFFKSVILFFLFISIVSCGQNPGRSGEGLKKKNFDIKSIAKSDIDIVLDIHVIEAREYLRELMSKLYKRNPKELMKSEYQIEQENIIRLFDLNHDWNFTELGGKKGVDAIYLTFDNTYSGDRVFSFITGLTSMVMASYEFNTDFYLFDSVDPQKLYNSARNIEIAVWKLEHNLDMQGELFLLSNSLPGEVVNLSFERLFGKLIATQDNIAIIIAGKTNRVIKEVIQRMATAVFLPI